MKYFSSLLVLEICLIFSTVQGTTDLDDLFAGLGVEEDPRARNYFRPFRPTFVHFLHSTQVLDSSTCIEEPSCASALTQMYVSLDGSCNNRVELNRGRSGRSLRRILPAAYADKKGQPRTGVYNRPLPGARNVSSAISDSVSKESSEFSHLVPFWGQFLIHDIAMTPLFDKHPNGSNVECECDDPSGECVNIEIPSDDIQYKAEKKTCFKLKRSLAVAKGGDLGCDTSVRQQMNTLTAFIDLGTIYGNNEDYLRALLDPDSEIGELREQQHGFHGEKSGLLPLQDEVENQTIADGMDCPVIQRPANLPCWVSGDVRANENSALASQHTFWMRQHNKLVRRFHIMNPHWSGAQLYKTTRSILIALVQKISYEHFLPALIGETHMRRFGLDLLRKSYSFGYDSSLDASVTNAFTTAAFRVGHSLIGSFFSRPNPSWNGNEAPPIILRESFFNNEPVMDSDSGGPNSILRGLLDTVAQLADPTVTHDLRNNLFAEQGKFGDDLLAINIERGRDHGIPGYTNFRKFCGLSVPRYFNDLHDISPEIRKKLADLYRDVRDIDLYVGGLSEDPVHDGLVGPTFACLISYQFRDIKKGDRFWHENGGAFKLFSRDQLKAIRETSYPKILCDGIENMESVQPSPMRIASGSNRRKPCSHYKGLDINPWRDDHVETQDHAESDEEADVEWTAWFPSTMGKVTLSPGETLSFLLQHRPDHVCHQVLDTQTRKVDENLQVRYKCLPGTIKYTDFPPVLSEDYIWTDWFDTSSHHRDSVDDDESKSKHRSVCPKPFAIQVQSDDGVPAGETGEVFETFSPHFGFVCRGKDQQSGHCENYRVRYLCRSQADNSATIKNVWSDWVSTDTQDNYGDMEFLTRARRRTKICRIPIGIEARTVDGKVAASKTGDRIRRMRPEHGFFCYNSDQRSKRCNNYEVRYLCPTVVTTSHVNRDDQDNRPTISDAVRYRMSQMCKQYNVCCA